MRKLYNGEYKQYIGTSKISKLTAKPNLTYPLIRLPQRYENVIGKAAHIYESSEEGQKSIILVFDEAESKEIENKEKVIQPIIKQNAESDFSARISVLEEETKELRTLIEKESFHDSFIAKKKRPIRDLNPSRSLDRARRALTCPSARSARS